MSVIPRPEHSISRASISPNALKVLYRLKEAGYQAFLVGRRRARSAARHHAQGFRRGDRRAARGGAAAVSQLPPDRPALSPGARAFRQRDHRGRDLPRGRGAGARGLPRTSDAEDDGSLPRSGGQRRAPRPRRGFGASRVRHHAGASCATTSTAPSRRMSGGATSPRTASTTTSTDLSIWDFVDGVADVKARRLKLIGDPETRYREDPVRMLRAVRFAAKLDFTHRAGYRAADSPARASARRRAAGPAVR